MEENLRQSGDIYMDSVRFVTFLNILKSFSETYTVNKYIKSTQFLCKNKSIFCSICIENIKSNEYVTKLKCCHQFHMKCINRWKKQCDKNKIISKCPMCRERL